MELVIRNSLLVYSVEAINPVDGTKMAVYIPQERVIRASEMGPFAVNELEQMVPRLLLSPKRMFQGVKKLRDPLAVAYVARPEFIYDKFGDAVSEWRGDERELVVIPVNCQKIVCDHWVTQRESHSSWNPVNWKEQFDRMVL